MNYLNCDVCDKIFNDLKPYLDHINSEKHKKKVNNFPENKLARESSGNQLDSTLLKSENSYMCTVCHISLNSLEQAQSHIKGTKHQKLLISSGYITDVGGYNANLSNLHISEAISKDDGTQDNEDRLLDHFSVLNTDANAILNNVKMFKCEEPISF